MLSRERWRRIGIDVIGFLLVILAGLFAWVPGPGGLPLLIIGLSLLATNHAWAARWVDSIKKRGGAMSKQIFSDYEPTRWMIDLLGITFIALAVTLITQFTRNVARTAAISLIFTAIFLLLGNRNRLKNLLRRLSKRS